MQVGLRLPTEAFDRADALKSKLAKDRNLALITGELTRTTILKLAVMRGLEVLEKEHSK